MTQNQNPFTIKPLNRHIKTKTPAPRSLFGEFWLEGELAVLFSDAGKGKSLLAAQIAQGIASGVHIEPLAMTAPAQKVLYFDFELSSAQFAMRYTDDPDPGDEFLKNPYRFSKNFYRAEPASADARVVRKPAQLAELEETIRSSGAKVVIIDSIAWLQGPNAAARHTVPLMRELKRIKSTHGLSILVLAHNPRRDNSRPLTISGLNGAGVMCNFADSVFALGQSRIDSSFRFIKHIKSRSTEILYDEKNVLVGEIRKWETNFLAFNFYKFSPESDHLSKEPNPMFEDRVRQIREMYEDKEMTQRDIAAELGISLGSVNRCLQMTIDDDFDPDDEDEENEKKDGDEAEKEDNNEKEDEKKDDDENEKKDDDEAEEGDKSEETEPVQPHKLGQLAELAQLGQLKDELAEPAELKTYKTLDDKIELGDIVRDRNGRLAKRTMWGWDYCADAIK